MPLLGSAVPSCDWNGRVAIAFETPNRQEPRGSSSSDELSMRRLSVVDMAARDSWIGKRPPISGIPGVGRG